jgi:uncharacterized protein (DUF2236 family)
VSETPLGPDSLTWRLGLPRTALLLAGRALTMQTAHPTIGAGVRDFSDFRTDPWGRLDRTVASLLTQLFGGQRSIDEARRLREMHKTITGTGFDGERYSALNPEAWAWVHLSNFDSGAVFLDLFVRALTRPERERLYTEYRQVGGLLGVRDQDMPPDLAGLHAYVDDMVEHRLDANATTRDLLESLTLRDVPPPSRLVPKPVWAAVRPAGRHLLRDATVGTLPPRLREKLDLDWTPEQERRLQRVATAIRRISPAVPPRIMHYPLAYQARKAALAAGWT